MSYSKSQTQNSKADPQRTSRDEKPSHLGTGSKKILIVTTTFYPDPSVGGIRMTQWSRHLPEFGWQPIVLSRYRGFSTSESDLAEKVHPALRLHYYDKPEEKPAPSSKEAEKLSDTVQPLKTNSNIAALKNSPSFIRRQKLALAKAITVPDPSIVFWQGSAREKTLALIQQEKPDVVLTTGPPHSVHDIGLWLSKNQSNLPWVADFRDPYLFDARYGLSGLRLLRAGKHRAFEAAIYEQATLVTHAIDFQARWARMQYPGARGKIRTAVNGCPTDLAEGNIPAATRESKSTRYCVMGATDLRQRSQLAQAAQDLNQSGLGCLLQLIGRSMPDEEALASCLGSSLLSMGKLPHAEALSQLQAADVLVCVLSDARSQCMGLSSKLFEFLACGKPIIVINPTRPDKLFLRSLRGVKLLTSPTNAAIVEAFRWSLTPEAQPPAEQAQRFRTKFSRRAQTETLAKWLDELL